MKNASKYGLRPTTHGISVNMAIMVVFLLCGIVAGCVAATYLTDSSSQFLTNYIDQYGEIARTGVSGYSFGGAFFNLVKYPAIIFILSFTALGIFCIPCILVIKGFFMSLSVSSVIHAIGAKGIFIALSMFGIQTFISLPCLLIISSIAFEFSKVFTNVLRRDSRIGTSYPISLKGYFLLAAACLIALLICALLDILFTPMLVNLSIGIAK